MWITIYNLRILFRDVLLYLYIIEVKKVSFIKLLAFVNSGVHKGKRLRILKVDIEM